MSKPDLKAKLEDVNAQIASVEKDAQTKWAAFEEKRDAFAKSGNEANRTDSQEFKDAEQVHREYAAACAELKQLEQVRDGVFAMVAPDAPAPSAATVPSEQKQQQPVQQEQAGGSLSERIASGKGYRDLVDSGVLGSDRRGGFQAKLADMSVAEVKTLITGLSDTSGGAFVFSDVKPYVAQPRRQPRLFDLITTGSTVSDTVEYARQTTFTNVAAETAEATATSTGTKPEATIAFERVTEYVRTIAHYIPATRRALADVGQLSTLIDSQLRYGLELRLEGQIVAGGGTGEDLKGILNQSNILTQALSTDSVADAIHKAVTQIRLGYIEPNGVAMHPNDWQLLRLARDNAGTVAGTGAYLYGPPSASVTPTIWGLPVAVTPAVTDDSVIVADFTQAVLWLREGAQVLASDSHSDFFIKNLVVLLAELRAAFGVLNPTAFCKVTSVD